MKIKRKVRFGESAILKIKSWQLTDSAGFCCCGWKLLLGEQKFFHGPKIDQGITNCPNHEYIGEKK